MRLADLLLVLVLGASAPAQVATTSEVIVPSGMEAWFHITAQPQEGAPPVNPYEQETLHVSATAGVERERTYLTLLLDAVPAGAEVTGGTLTLHVHAEGSVNVEAAQIVVCAVPDPPQSVQGSLEPPPDVDCSRRAEAAFHQDPSPHVRVDLAPFDSLDTEGLALMPDEGPDTWHVAFYAKDHPADRPITAVLTVASPAPPPAPPPPFVPESPPAGANLGPVEEPPPVALMDPAAPVLVPTPPVRTPEPDRVIVDASFVDPTHAYLSWVLLVPLALLLFLAYFGRALVVEDERA